MASRQGAEVYAGSSATNSIANALGWLEGTLLGTVATAVAILAVASVGLLMLTGRIDFRRATQVVLGCFIVLGASTIAAGIQAAISGQDSAPPGAAVDEADQYYPPADPPTYPKAPPAAYDPYAGAAVPPRQ